MEAPRDRAYFQVLVGVVPGSPEPEFSKTWVYTEAEFEKDLARPENAEGEGGEATLSIFQQKMQAANNYALSMIDPAHVNWVHFTWLWL